MTKQKGKPVPTKSKPAKKPNESSLSIWIENNYKILSYSIVGLALLLRIWLLIQLPSLPFSELHKSPDLDMKFFDQWGDRIAHGDFLTDTVWHPYHNWHKAAAEYYGVKSDEEGKAKWNEWYGGKTYHQEPLYALILGFCKMIAGNGHLLMYILQILSTLFSIWMIMWLGRHYFGALAGISSGLLFALYSPGLLFDVVLLRTSFTTCYLLALLFVAEKLMMGKSKPWLFGLLGGVGYVLQTTALLLWLPLLIRWWYVKKTDIGRSWQVAIGFACILSLLIARNSIVGAPLMSASSVGPVTYVLSNFPEYKPELGFVYFEQIGKLLDRTDGKMFASAKYVIGMHHSILSWVNLQFKKLALVFHWYEVPNNINSYLPMEFSLPLRLAFIPWSLIGALGLTGMIFNFRNKKTLNLLFGIVSQVAVMVVFYVLCRFRIPMVAMMAVYGGYTLQTIIKYADMRKVWLTIGCSILMFLFMIRPYPKINVRFFSGELANYFFSYYIDRLDAAVASKDFKTGIKLESQFIGSQPDFVKHLDQHMPMTNQDQKDLVRYYGKLYGDLGDFYKDDGQQQKAEESYRMMDKLTNAAK
jgi:hypothetical protein